MKLSHVLLSAALALGAASAQAANLGPLDLSSGSAGFSSTPVIGAFVDTYTFTLVGPTLASGSVTTVVNGAQDVDFTSISVSGPAGTFAFTQSLPDPVEVWALPSALLTAGTYTLTLTGTNSPGGASYGGNFAVSPVPEPESLALLLAGIGAVGFVVRNRRPNA